MFDNIHWDLVLYLLVAWGVITLALIVFMLYRRALSAREDDQIFLAPSEQHIAAEQSVIFQRITKTTVPIATLAILSVVLALTTLGLWLYQGWKSFQARTSVRALCQRFSAGRAPDSRPAIAPAQVRR